MKKHPFILTAILLAWFSIFTTTTASAQTADDVTFDDYFDGRTLRLDYIFAGDSVKQHIFFHNAYSTAQWAGRRSRLAEKLLNGNGQIAVLEQGTGRVLYVSTFSTLFQEWQSTDEAKHVSRSFQSSYLVPMPKLPVDIRVTLTDTHRRITASLTHPIDPADILIRPLEGSGLPHEYVLQSGNVTDCVDIAILADGYAESEMPKFLNDCRRATEALFGHEPFASMKQKFNVVAVVSPSLDSGPSIPRSGEWRQTACGSHYDTFYTDRYLMTSEIHHIYDLLADVPFEHIIVMVNSSTYGGGGIYNQITVTTSDHPTFKPVLVHEFGHAYGGLGDEYDYGDDMAQQYNSETEPWEPNLTTLVDFQSKWADMLPDGTPIPTPKADIPNFRRAYTADEWEQIDAATQRVGVFEGGGYQTHGVYRPAQECRMKINEVSNFCPVCSRAIRRITEFYTAR
ncbi:MAG: M64 family metallopeptidase [Bacteroidales bacterium]|nr:M64 family metallopeptidase [Bacteroidales bacterium]